MCKSVRERENECESARECVGEHDGVNVSLESERERYGRVDGWLDG